MRKYQLPPTSTEFTKRTEADLNLEYFEDTAVQLEDLEETLERLEKVPQAGEDAERLHAMRDQRHLLRVALGLESKTSQKEAIMYDPVIAKWEDELERGLVPDLSESGAVRG